MVTAPAPAIVLLNGVKTPELLIVMEPPMVSVRRFSATVCVPLAPPMIRNEPVNVVSMVTVYVPGSPMITESAVCGTRPRFQLAGLLHTPPAGLDQASAPAVMSNGELTTDERPLPLAARV